MMQVNRFLKDKHFDRIDHALGRPIDPMKPTYREYFATDTNGSQAALFRASPHWREGRCSDDMAFFYVTDAGREALSAHLREIGDPHRLFSVEWDGMVMSQVATSRSKARYLKWLSISECYEISFKDFAATARVRLAA